MKTLRYFENKADKLIATGDIDYRLITKGQLILNLMKQYRTDNKVSWMNFKPVFDKWFTKYCNN